jgi:CheY-like chemotaxis protein
VRAWASLPSPMVPINSFQTGWSSIILLAEDQQSDAMFFQLAMEACGLSHILVMLEDGHEAVAYLRGDSPYANRSLYPLPRLIVLDLEMPRMGGFDVLTWLGSQPNLRHLPVVILSGSADQANMAKARQLGAADYLVKTHRMSDLVGIVQSLDARWLSRPPRYRNAEAAESLHV